MKDKLTQKERIALQRRVDSLGLVATAHDIGLNSATLSKMLGGGEPRVRAGSIAQVRAYLATTT